MSWLWDNGKNRSNRQKHGLSFETAALVFDDALAASRPDHYPNEQRWQTIGRVGTVVVFVVHIALELDPATGDEVGRIISARKATAHERRIYEEEQF